MDGRSSKWFERIQIKKYHDSNSNSKMTINIDLPLSYKTLLLLLSSISILFKVCCAQPSPPKQYDHDTVLLQARAKEKRSSNHEAT